MVLSISRIIFILIVSLKYIECRLYYSLISLNITKCDSRFALEHRYKATLAKRLLSGRSNSDSEERGMITRLKTECGYQFVSKMEGMWKDIESISREVNQRYEAWMRRNHSEDESDGGVKINIYVLTTKDFGPQRVPRSVLIPRYYQTVSCLRVSIFKNSTALISPDDVSCGTNLWVKLCCTIEWTTRNKRSSQFRRIKCVF